ncbi:MAG: molecular chaperone TorD family protein [Burkholderiales bacterium]|nr:molecular chaperone TorD family protein [Burkholderiales bacterium]
MTNPPISSALDEETARAELYGVIAELFYAPHRAELLAQMRVAATEAPSSGGYLEEPWRELVGVAREMDDGAIQKEHDALFAGVGKPEIYPFASHFLSGFLNEKPLAKLREDLAVLGLTRDANTMSETEDHISYVLEVMRFLVAGEDASVSNLTQQAKFFADHVQTWVPTFCNAVLAHPKARFYAALAELTRSLVSVEAQAFDLMA